MLKLSYVSYEIPENKILTSLMLVVLKCFIMRVSEAHLRTQPGATINFVAGEKFLK